jgi:hypothetical protein
MTEKREILLMEKIRENKNVIVIQIITNNKLFEERFDGSMSYFFRCLKNGLYTLGIGGRRGGGSGMTNREYFKNISGMYFSLEKSEELEILILVDKSSKHLNELQVKARIKKLLGINTQIKIGELEEFEERIKEMFGIKRRTQVFGDYYFENKKDGKNTSRKKERQFIL